jgi:glutamate racemase
LGHDLAKIVVGVFDSGVGGLTVLKEMRSQCPNIRIVYCLDNQGFPYGGKGDQWVEQRVLQAVSAVNLVQPLDLIVIACNTASTSALNCLRARFAQPIVGVVPAIKPAALQSKTKQIVLLATPTTAAGAYVDKLVAEFAPPPVAVIRVGSKHLATLAETKLTTGKVDLAQVAAEIAPCFVGNADIVVLGCTHFPHLLSEFQAVAPRPMVWLDSSEAIARRVAALTHRMPAQQTGNGDVAFVTGERSDAYSKLFAEGGFEVINYVSV